MPNLGDELHLLTEQNALLAEMDVRRRGFADKRDQTVRRAKEAGASWEDLLGTGISRATIAKALRQ